MSNVWLCVYLHVFACVDVSDVWLCVYVFVCVCVCVCVFHSRNIVPRKTGVDESRQCFGRALVLSTSGASLRRSTAVCNLKTIIHVHEWVDESLHVLKRVCVCVCVCVCACV